MSKVPKLTYFYKITGSNNQSTDNISIDNITDNNTSCSTICKRRRNSCDQIKEDNIYYKLRNKNNSLINEINLLTKEKVRLENELKKKDELNTITLNELTREIEKINNKNNDKENENKKLIKDNQHLISIIEDKSKENDKLRQVLEEKIEIIQQLEQENQSKGKRLSECDEVKKSFDKEINELNNKLKEITVEVKYKEQIISDLQDENQQIKDIMFSAKLEIENLENQCKMINQQLKQKKEKNLNSFLVQANENRKEAENTLINTKHELVSLSNDLIKEKKENEEYQKKNRQLKQELDNKLSEIEEYKNKIYLLLELNSKLSYELQVVMEEDSLIKDQLKTSILNREIDGK